MACCVVVRSDRLVPMVSPWPSKGLPSSGGWRTGIAWASVDSKMRNSSQIAVGTCQVLPSMLFLVRSSVGGVLV